MTARERVCIRQACGGLATRTAGSRPKAPKTGPAVPGRWPEVGGPISGENDNLRWGSAHSMTQVNQAKEWEE